MIDAHFEKRIGSFKLEASIRDSGLLLLTGRNGAGKSTCLLCLLGRYDIDAGYVRLNGRDLAGIPVGERRIAFVNQSTYFGHLDVDRHLLWGERRGTAASAAVDMRRLKEVLGIDYGGKVGKLSLGQRIRVAIGTAIISSPEALLLDEAVSNLSEPSEFLGKLKSIASEMGIDVLYVSQDPGEGKVADHHYILRDGKMSREF